MIADLRSRGVRWDDLDETERLGIVGWWRSVRWIEIIKIREGYRVG